MEPGGGAPSATSCHLTAVALVVTLEDSVPAAHGTHTAFVMAALAKAAPARFDGLMAAAAWRERVLRAVGITANGLHPPDASFTVACFGDALRSWARVVGD